MVSNSDSNVQVQPSQQMQEYLSKAKQLSTEGKLRAYSVAIRCVDPKGGDPGVQVFTVIARTWSHVAARFDNPEEGMEILDQRYLSPGVVLLEDIEKVARFVDPIAKAKVYDKNMDGLGMCSHCMFDFNLNADKRCHAGGHRLHYDKADKPCSAFKPKVQ